MESLPSPSPVPHTSSKHCIRGPHYPEPVVVQPTKPHTHSVILLHGRGSNGARFGLELVEAAKTSVGGTGTDGPGRSLKECFPSVKFIFPTASKRRSTVLKRVPINQWFDNYSLDDPTQRQDLQYDGLQQTARMLADLVRQEAASLNSSCEGGGLRHVIVGGLSQGCAMALIAALGCAWVDPAGGGDDGASTIEIQSLGGFIGMSGWLPFAQDIRDAASSTAKKAGLFDDDDDDDNDDDEDEEEEEDDDDDDEEKEEEDEDDIFETTPAIPLPSTTTARPSDRAPASTYSRRRLEACNYVRDAILDLQPLPLPTPGGEEAMPYFLGHGSADAKVAVGLGQQAADLLARALGLHVSWRAYDGQGHWYKVPDELDDIVSFLSDKVGIPLAPAQAH